MTTNSANAVPWAAPRSPYRSPLISITCLVFGVVASVTSYATFDQTHDTHITPYFIWFFAIDAAVGVIAAVASGPMHAAGRWNLVLVALGSIGSFSWATGFVGLIRMGARRGQTDMWIAAGIWLLGACYVAPVLAREPLLLDGLASGLLFNALVCGAFLAWGRSRGNRAELVEAQSRELEAVYNERRALEKERKALSAARRDTVARVRAEERSALARDMHDSISHHLSIIAINAGALAYRDDLSTEQTTAAATTLHEAARAANAELAGVLTALRAGDATRDTQPLATSGTIAHQVEAFEDAQLRYVGMDAQELDAFPGATRGTLERIVAELLVNSRKYGAGGTDVVLAHVADELVLTASNPARTPNQQVGGDPIGTGMGLVGVAERARLLGGSSRDYREADRFVVEVRIPWHTR